MEPIEFEYEKPEYDAPEPEKSEFEAAQSLSSFYGDRKSDLCLFLYLVFV